MANDDKNRGKTSQTNNRVTPNIGIDPELIFEEENTSYD